MKSNVNGLLIAPCADLTGADLTYADLTSANLIGADLTSAKLIGATIKSGIKCSGNFMQLGAVAEWGPIFAWQSTEKKRFMLFADAGTWSFHRCKSTGTTERIGKTPALHFR